MSTLRITHPTKTLTGHFALPASKSICNRMLIAKQVLELDIPVTPVSDADDCVIMQYALQRLNGIINVHHAGTCMRFLTAYYATTPGADVILHGSERMHQRPIAPLVDALTALGADIDYIDLQGFPPLRIKGKKLNGGVVEMDGSISSQYTSALMLVAPRFTNGLVITHAGTAASFPYINMTAAVLRQCGVMVHTEPDIVVKPFTQTPAALHQLTVEPDWSAAAFWYLMAALSKQCEVRLNHLRANSMQGDAMIANYMERFGVQSTYNNDGVTLNKTVPLLDKACYNMYDYPDMVPAMAVLMCALNMSCTFTHVAHLEAKESKRLSALCTELSKCGFDISHNGMELQINPSDPKGWHTPALMHTHGDHRMAMAFAPLALLFNEVTIAESEVVNKSYPTFWKDLQDAGFRLTIVN